MEHSPGCTSSPVRDANPHTHEALWKTALQFSPTECANHFHSAGYRCSAGLHPWVLYSMAWECP